MRIPLILLTLGLLSFNACAVEPPSTEPFAKRYDPHSITTAARAREVIAAYDNEKRAWENWYKEETAQCYRNFFVTYCLDKAKSERTEHINEARRVWLVARDFLRKERSEQAVKDRKAAEAKQAAKNAKMDAQPARVAKVPPKTRDVTPRKPGEGHAADRVLTPEEEKANAEAYAKKQQEREERQDRCLLHGRRDRRLCLPSGAGISACPPFPRKSPTAAGMPCGGMNETPDIKENNQ